MSHAIRNRLETLGIEGYTTHGLRKNAGMELAEAGCTVEEIMAVLGHKTPKMALFSCERSARGDERKRGRQVGRQHREERGEEAGSARCCAQSLEPRAGIWQ